MNMKVMSIRFCSHFRVCSGILFLKVLPGRPGGRKSKQKHIVFAAGGLRPPDPRNSGLRPPRLMDLFPKQSSAVGVLAVYLLY